MRNRKRRQEAKQLKKDLQGSDGPGEVRLTMADGTEHVIPLGGGKDPLLVLRNRLLADPNSPESRLIRSAVEIVEPDNSHMLEMTCSTLLDNDDPPPPAPRGPIAPPPTDEAMRLRLLNMPVEGPEQ